MLTTLTRPTAGLGIVGAQDVEDPAAVGSLIGVTMQDAALDPAMVVQEHVLLAG